MTGAHGSKAAAASFLSVLFSNPGAKKDDERNVSFLQY